VYYIHGAVATGWMALAVVQPLLIASRRVTLHRQVGWLGAAVAGAVVLMNTLAVLASAARPDDSVPPPTPLEFVGVLLSAITVFAILVGLAIAFRRDGPSHKRLMYLATINLLQAAIVRIPLGFLYDAGPVTTFSLAYTFIVPLLGWDVAVWRRVHPATLWGGLGLIVSLPVRFWFSETAVGLAVAKWAVDLMGAMSAV